METDLRPYSEGEKSLFYSAQKDADDEALATVGHLRADFGRLGKDFQSSWNPHNGDRFNTPEFKSELQEIVNSLRENGSLKSLSAMRKYCAERGAAELEEGAYGFIAETERFRYALRFTPSPGQYHPINEQIQQFDENARLMRTKSQKTSTTHGLLPDSLCNFSNLLFYRYESNRFP